MGLLWLHAHDLAAVHLNSGKAATTPAATRPAPLAHRNMALFRTFISALLCACAARAFVQPRPLRASTGTALSAAGGVDRRSALGLALVVLAPGAASAASQYQKIEAPTAEWEAAEKRAEEFRKRQRELAATFNGYFDAFSAASSDETVIENLNKMTLFIENMGGLPQGITSRQVVSRCRAKKSDFLQSGKWGTPAEIAYQGLTGVMRKLSLPL